MKTVLVLAGLVALVCGGAIPQEHQHNHVTTKPVDANFVKIQKKVYSLLYNVEQVDTEAEYYKIGKDYDVKANIDNYTNKQAVEEFLYLYKRGFMPKNAMFSVFYENMREEAIAIFHLFYYAKDFETFYKTACFARVHFNTAQFVYAYYVAVYQRDDTHGIVLPAMYEMWPEIYVNSDVINRVARLKMQNGVINSAEAAKYGIVTEDNHYIVYANYSNTITYSHDDVRLSYFTEDIGLNSYYFYFHANFPFWLDGKEFGPIKERRGEGYFYFYQQLLARYYLERLTNGLGEIPEFSWNNPIKTKYHPLININYPLTQRNEYYHLNNKHSVQDIQFLETYEQTFLQYLERGHLKAYNQEVDMHKSKAINFVGNYWQSNADLYEKTGERNYQRSYEITAAQVLGASPEPHDSYYIAPSALEIYQTSLRDPVFYQLYSRIMNYQLQYKEYLQRYTQDNLHFVGVKINKVEVDDLVTYFDYFDFDVTNAVYKSAEELKTKPNQQYKIRQPRLNHKPFTVTIDVKSDVTSDAVVKVFLGPKYDSNGYPIKLEDNWMNFVELDYFVHKLTQGQNVIKRHSDEFFFYKEDSVPTGEVIALLEQGKVPKDMSESMDDMPQRLMLPRGVKGGYPFQLFVVVYPYQAIDKDMEEYKDFILDAKPFGYPFDRPVDEVYFVQPNMYFEDVEIHHEGDEYPYTYTIPGNYGMHHHNEVPKQ